MNRLEQRQAEADHRALAKAAQSAAGAARRLLHDLIPGAQIDVAIAIGARRHGQDVGTACLVDYCCPGHAVAALERVTATVSDHHAEPRPLTPEDPCQHQADTRASLSQLSTTRGRSEPL